MEKEIHERNEYITESCDLCKGAKKMNRNNFVEHVFGKKHLKASSSVRFERFEKLPNRRKTLKIEGYPKENFKEVVSYFWLYNMIDVYEDSTGCNIRFKTQSDVEYVMKHKHFINEKPIQAMKKSDSDAPTRKFVFKKPNNSVHSLGGSSNKGQGQQQEEEEKKPKVQLSEELKAEMKTIFDEKWTDDLILKLIKEIELKKTDYEQREKARFLMQQFLNPMFPGVKVHNFGSSVNNLGFINCDVDMYANLQYDPWSCGNKSQMETKAAELTKYIAKEIRKRTRGSFVIPIPRARVPIIKFIERETKLAVDLSFRSPMPLCNSNLIKVYTKCHPIVRPYLMLLRYWATVQDISGGGRPATLITNYCFTMMMLFNLIKLRIAPSVQWLKEQHYLNYDSTCRPTVVDGWDCSFSDDVDEWKTLFHETSLIRLAKGFFLYFGEKKFSDSVISPLSGGLISRTSLYGRDPKELPIALYPFCRGTGQLWFHTCLCVQDPFEQTHNIARGLGEKALAQFQIKCRHAAEICAKIIDKEASLSRLFEPINVSIKELGEVMDDHVKFVRHIFTASYRTEKSPEEVNSSSSAAVEDDSDEVMVLSDDSELDDDDEVEVLDEVITDTPSEVPKEVEIEFDLVREVQLRDGGTFLLAPKDFDSDEAKRKFFSKLLLFVLEKCLLLEVSPTIETSPQTTEITVELEEGEEEEETYESPPKRLKTCPEFDLPADRTLIDSVECIARFNIFGHRKSLSKKLCLCKNVDSPVQYAMQLSDLVKTQIKAPLADQVPFVVYLSNKKELPSQYFISFHFRHEIECSKLKKNLTDIFSLLSNVLFDTRNYIKSLTPAN